MRELAREVKLLREKDKIVLAAKRDMFLNRCCTDKYTIDEQKQQVKSLINGYVDLQLMDFRDVVQFLDLAYFDKSL